MIRYSQLQPRQRVLAFVLLIILLIGSLFLWMYFPALLNAGRSNGYSCTRAHIYLPVRLDFKGCQTITGEIKRVKVEQDGDIHVQLQLDMQYKYLLTPQNYRRQGGNIVIEDMCQGRPKDPIQIFAKLACFNYKSPFANPTVGKRYEITGNYVVDDWHGSWAEIHGISELKQLN